MANLYDKAGLVNIPVGYQDGFLYNIKPEDNTLGFRFNRDSAATRVNKEGLIEQVGYFGPELVQNGDFSQLGPELVTNGDFATDSSWVKGAGWTISNGSANASNSTSDLYQENIVQSGKYYKVTYTISNYVSGSVRVELPNNSYAGIERSANGTYTETLLSNGTTLLFDARTSFTGSIDNVSVKQVDPNDYWILGAGWSIGDGVASCNGTQAGNSSLFQGNVLTQNKFYKFEFTLSNVTAGSVRLRNGVGFSETYIDYKNSDGTYAVYATVNSSNTTLVVDADSNFNGSVTNISVIEVLGDKPRIDYTDSLTSPSFLLEPQSTNLYPFSQNVNPNGLIEYVSGSATLSLTNNYSISPDGTKNALRFQGTVTNNSSDRAVLRDLISTSAVMSTVSVYAKSNTDKNYTMAFHYTGGNKVTFTVTPEWQRFSYSENSTTSNFAGVELRGTFTSLEADVSLWGFQFENQSYATSVIPTSGSTVTRTQETCNNAGNVSTFNSTEGVLYAEIAALADDNTYRILSLSDGTTNERVYIQYTNASNTVAAVVKNGGVTQANRTYVLSDETEFAKVAFKFKQNDFALWVNGIEVGTDTSGNTPTGLSRLAFDNGATTNFYGKTKGIYVFNKALTDDELQQLTGPEYNSFAALAAAYNYTVI